MTNQILERLGAPNATNPADSVRGIAEATGRLRTLWFDLGPEHRTLLRENIWSLEQHALNLSRTLGLQESELLARVLENLMSAHERSENLPVASTVVQKSPEAGKRLSLETGWTTGQVAKFLGISTNYVRDYAQRKLLTSERHLDGRKVFLLFDPAEVKAFHGRRNQR